MPLLQTSENLVSRFRNREPISSPEPEDGIRLSRPVFTGKTGSHQAPNTNHDAPVDEFLLEEHPGSTASSSNGIFTNAHDLLIRDSNIINVEHLVQIIDSGRAAMRLLEDRRIPGAEVDSSARYPPPKCHPSTREDLRSRITKWLMDNNRGRNILCLLGPAGIGKSAIAQTIAEQCKRTGRLGAAFFFSRPNHRDDPTRVIPTLAHQLAIQHTDYRRVITQRLADDSTILEKDMRTQFRELIIEPFKIISSCNSSILQRPLLIVLDGLDECDGEEAQCEFIDLINEHVRLTKKPPLIWMICSRPEWHLETILSDVDYVIEYHREVLKVDDAQSQKDVLRVLRDGFNDVQRQYRDVLDEPWPSETQLRQLAVASSGLFIFALTLLKFIGDRTCGNPNAQLALILQLINNPWTPITLIAANPFHTLDLLYKQILSSIPANILGTTKRILGLCVYCPGHNMSTHALANFLGLDKGTFYAAIRRLHSVLDVPAAGGAHSCPIQFYHASFREFLKNPSRSGVFVLTEGEVFRDFVIPCIQWCNYRVGSNCRLNDRCCIEAPGLSWTLQDRREELYEEIGRFAKTACWRVCYRISKGDVTKVVDELHKFQFCHLRYVGEDFVQFVNWLHSLHTPLLRGEPSSSFDDHLIQLYNDATPNGTGVPRYSLDAPATQITRFPIHSSFKGISMTSKHVAPNEFPAGQSPFFIGIGDNTCLANPRGRFRCDVCNREFPVCRALERHILSVHMKVANRATTSKAIQKDVTVASDDCRVSKSSDESEGDSEEIEVDKERDHDVEEETRKS